MNLLLLLKFYIFFFVNLLKFKQVFVLFFFLLVSFYFFDPFDFCWKRGGVAKFKGSFWFCLFGIVGSSFSFRF